MCACEREALLGPYHDGELSDAARREVEAHVASCPDCARELQRLRAISQRLEPLRGTKLSNFQKSDLADLLASGGQADKADESVADRGVAGRIGFGDNVDSPAFPNPTAAPRTGGSAGTAVRWVRWLTAAAAALFLFAMAQLFLADRINPPRNPIEQPTAWPNGVPRGGTPGATQPGTKSAKPARPAGGDSDPVDAPLQRTRDGDAASGSSHNP